MKRGLFVLVLLAAAISAGTAGAGGNSDAAHACQQNGYLNLQRSDGSPFANVGDCVGYFARGGAGIAGCTVTATSGCLIFDNVVMTNVDGSGSTITVNAAYSFNTTCNSLDQTTTCPTGTPNDFAMGGGTYVIKDAAGTVVEQGTLTTAAQGHSAVGGLEGAFYAAADNSPTSCSAAASRGVELSSSTNVTGDPTILLGADTDPSNPVSEGSGATAGSYGTFQGGIAGVTLSC